MSRLSRRPCVESAVVIAHRRHYVADTKLPVAIRSNNSLGAGAYIRGCGEPSDATAKASITAPWFPMPPSKEKPARTFTHTGDTGTTVVVPLMIFLGTHGRRKPESQQRRNAHAAERKGKGKGKGRGQGKGKGKPIDPRDL